MHDGRMNAYVSHASYNAIFNNRAFAVSTQSKHNQGYLKAVRTSARRHLAGWQG